MTREEIVDALTRCSKPFNQRGCDTCPVGFREGCALDLKKMAIEALESQRGSLQVNTDYIKWLDEIDKALDVALEVLESQSWIPCSERLPEANEDVLLQLPKGMAVGFWENDMDAVFWSAKVGNGYWTDIGYSDDADAPIAWMPLPEPYKEGE